MKLMLAYTQSHVSFYNKPNFNLQATATIITTDAVCLPTQDLMTNLVETWQPDTAAMIR